MAHPKLNCPNCGAPFHGRVCEYCGTDYRREIDPLKIQLREMDSRGYSATIHYFGREFNVFLIETSVEMGCSLEERWRFVFEGFAGPDSVRKYKDGDT